MSRRTHGFSIWGTFVVLALIFSGMTFAMLYGTGVFKNWGKRSLSEDADRILYAAIGRLLQGDVSDQSTTFPSHIAGRSALEIYQVLRKDASDKPAIDAAYSELELLSTRLEDPAAGLKASTKALKNLELLYENRQERAARMVLRLKSWAPESDRLTRQYRKIAQAFQDQETVARDPRDKRAPPDESDNLFGGPNRTLELKIEFGTAVKSIYELLLKNPRSYLIEGGTIRATDPKSEFADSYTSTSEKLDRLRKLVSYYERRLETAVAAERRGLKRSLGL